MPDPRHPLDVLVDILSAEMTLASGRVMQENQRFPISLEEGVYIFLRDVSPKAIASKNWLETIALNTVEEVQQTSMVSLVQIDIMSADYSAVERKEEVLMALNSIYAERQMEENNMQISKIPQSFANASELEGTSRMNRFSATMAVAWMKTKRKALTDWYDTIPTPEVVPNG